MIGDMVIRKVKNLGDRCKKQAKEMGLDKEDLVLVEIEIKQSTPPIYTLTKIEGSPLEFLQKKFLSPKTDDHACTCQIEGIDEDFHCEYYIGCKTRDNLDCLNCPVYIEWINEGGEVNESETESDSGK